MSRFILGKAAMVVDYQGQELKLYRSKAIRSVMNRSAENFLDLEKAGWIPEPMFKRGPMKLYSLYEIQALADLVREMGVPRFGERRPESHKWKEALQNRWSIVREALYKGEIPPHPHILRFETREELEVLMSSLLRPVGVDSLSFIKRVTDRLLEHEAL